MICALSASGDPLDDRRGIFVARVNPVEVENREAPSFPIAIAKVDVDDAIHRRAPNWDRELEAVAQREGDVDLVWVKGHASWHERDLVETIRAASVTADPNLEARLLPGNHSAGCEPTLIQGVLTPMAVGFSKL